MDEGDAFGTVSDAIPAKALHRGVMALRREGKAREAIAQLEAEDIATDEVAQQLYLRTLFDIEDYARFVPKLTAAITDLRHLPKPGGEYMNFLLHFAEIACLPNAVMDELLRRTRRPALGDAAIAPIWGATATRQRFRAMHRASIARPYQLISLGLNCLPWVLANRWALRPDAAQFIGTFNPFSLAAHKLEGVARALSSDFATYAQAEDFIAVKTARGHIMPMRRDRDAVWNHQKGKSAADYWMADGYRNLRASLDHKIANLRANCRAEAPVFLLATCTVNHPEEKLEVLPELQEGLRRMTGRAANHLIITNQQHERAGHNLFHIDPHTTFFYCKYPSRQYFWCDPKASNSPEGLIYERRYAQLVRRCLERWGLVGAAPAQAPAVQAAAD